jgi:hypothetical protein
MRKYFYSKEKEKNMQKDKMIKLIEDLNSAGYRIIKIHCPYDCNIIVSLHHIGKIKNPFSKERMVNLVEILFSIGYYITEYELLQDRFCGIKLELHILE